MKNKLNPIFALVICAVLWSTGGFLIKTIDWSPLAITGGRSGIAALFMMLALRRKPVFYIADAAKADAKNGSVPKSKSFNSIDKKATLNLWLGAICYSLTMILFVVATKMTTAANAVLLQYTNPIWIIIFGPALIGEKNRKSDYLAVVGVLAGMILFFAEDIGGGSFMGNIIAIVAGVAMGFMSIFMRRQKDASPEDSFVLSHLITLLIALPFFFAKPLGNGIVGIACILALGIVQIGLPSIMYSIGISGESALTSMLISMIEPVMNPIWVMLIVHEVPSVSAIAGGVIILGTIIARGYIQNKRK